MSSEAGLLALGHNGVLLPISSWNEPSCSNRRRTDLTRQAKSVQASSVAILTGYASIGNEAQVQSTVNVVGTMLV